MDAIGIRQPVPVQSYPAPVPASQPAAPQPAPSAPVDLSATVDVQVEAAEQRRFEAVKKASQDAPNVYPLGDRTFTIFKDSSGQYITRYFSQRTGQVSYSPELETLKLSSAAPMPSVKIQA